MDVKASKLKVSGGKNCCEFIIPGMSDLNIDYDRGQLCQGEKHTQHDLLYFSDPPPILLINLIFITTLSRSWVKCSRFGPYPENT